MLPSLLFVESSAMFVVVVVVVVVSVDLILSSHVTVTKVNRRM